MREKLPEKAVAMNRFVDTPFTIPQCVEAFKAGFETSLQIELVPHTLTEEQLAYVKELEAKKYANDEWNFRK